MSTPHQPPPTQVGKLINLIPVGLKEAALDSPTFRATTLHFGEQVELIEKWLDDYLRSTTKLTGEIGTLETLLNSFLSHATLPTAVSEAVVDHDYSLLAIRKYGDGAKDFWTSTIGILKRLNILVVEPIRLFMAHDLRAFKDVRRTLDLNQKQYDNVQARYSAQAKSKEPSAIREEAFQLHEARKAYLKSSMDFCVLAPQLRTTLDKLIVRVFFDQWKEMRVSRDNVAATLGRSSQEMERVKGWTREMENSEKAFRRELHAARKQLEETAESAARPSRELDDYSVSTMPYMGTAAGSTMSLKSPRKATSDRFEKQGWLNLRTYTGKPMRTLWVRRWAFVKNGILGWLVQGARSGGVEETERIGVLLCNVRPAGQEERRFCFEVKTKKNAMMVQAETQTDLSEWISVFEAAKQRALSDPASTDALLPAKAASSTDPAFSISPPPVPEFAASFSESLSLDEIGSGDRSTSLALPGADVNRDSGDIAQSRRSTMLDREDGTRDHAARIISKLDLHRKSAAVSSTGGSPSTPTTGGIASLIAASHGSMPVGPGVPVKVPDTDPQKPKSSFILALRDMPSNSLAPSTLANPPAPTNLSKVAVVVSGERGIGVGSTGGMPGGMLANLWGSSNWGFVNRLERGEIKSQEPKPAETPTLAPPFSGSPPKGRVMSLMKETTHGPSSSTTDLPNDTGSSTIPSLGKIRHRSTISLDGDIAELQRAAIAPQDFPNYYPLQLKTQDAQFRLLFPNVHREERLVLVFRATWNPNDQQEFPGRVYVTTDDVYFYSNHLGLVLTSGVTLKSIAEVTAAPGRDCDFLFLHLKESNDGQPTRITIKTFLDGLHLLQKRLNFLVRNSDMDTPLPLEEVIKTLIRMEQDAPQRSPSLESWEDVSISTPQDDGSSSFPRSSNNNNRSLRTATDLKAPIRVDRTLESYAGRSGTGPEIHKFKLPAQPVEYVPTGNLHLAAEKKFEISPKALFHVLFGDRSAVWQLLHHQRQAQDIKQGPWISLDHGHYRREFEYGIETQDGWGRGTRVNVRDYQVVDVMNDHLCYVVTDKRTAWHLPYKRNFRLVSKLVITHSAKSKSKLAIYTKVEWIREPWVLKGVVTAQALSELSLSALDILDLLTDQVRRLGPYSRTRKAIQIFGTIGQSTSTMQFSAQDSIGADQMNLETRLMPKQRSLFTLLFQTLASLSQSAVTSVMMWSGGFVRWGWKTVNANSLILSLLVISLLANTFYTGRNGVDWWHERNAGRFMKRLGVMPGQVMGKAIYTGDLERLVSDAIPVRDAFGINETVAAAGAGPVSGNLCFNTFFEETSQLGFHDMPKAPGSPSSPALRIQQTRQRLGSYRHDLLVAIRVVNSIEKEVLKGEWETWIREEIRRCGRVGNLLDNDGDQLSETNVGDAILGQREDTEEVRKWYAEYCGSCEREGRALW